MDNVYSSSKMVKVSSFPKMDKVSSLSKMVKVSSFSKMDKVSSLSKMPYVQCGTFIKMFYGSINKGKDCVVLKRINFTKELRNALIICFCKIPF